MVTVKLHIIQMNIIHEIPPFYRLPSVCCFLRQYLHHFDHSRNFLYIMNTHNMSAVLNAVANRRTCTFHTFFYRQIEYFTIMPLRDVPSKTGYPRSAIADNPCIANRFCSRSFAKPMPGSNQIISSLTPARLAISILSCRFFYNSLHERQLVITIFTVMHQNDRYFIARRHFSNCRFPFRTPYIINYTSARHNRRFRYNRL